MGNKCPKCGSSGFLGLVKFHCDKPSCENGTGIKPEFPGRKLEDDDCGCVSVGGLVNEVKRRELSAEEVEADIRKTEAASSIGELRRQLREERARQKIEGPSLPLRSEQMAVQPPDPVQQLEDALRATCATEELRQTVYCERDNSSMRVLTWRGLTRGFVCWELVYGASREKLNAICDKIARAVETDVESSHPLVRAYEVLGPILDDPAPYSWSWQKKKIEAVNKAYPETLGKAVYTLTLGMKCLLGRLALQVVRERLRR